jgi:hypothetical protein
MGDRPEHARPDHFGNAGRHRVIPPVERFHDDLLRIRRGSLGDQLGVGRVAGERLFDERMLAGLERGNRPRPVEGRRRADVDRVDGVARQQFVVRPERQWDTPAVGRRACPIEVAGGDRDQLDTWYAGVGERLDNRPVGDSRGGDQSDADGNGAHRAHLVRYGR